MWTLKVVISPLLLVLEVWDGKKLIGLGNHGLGIF